MLEPIGTDVPLLSVRGLGIGFDGTPAVADVSFDIHARETVGLVGESGCGKSVTGLAIMGLLPPRAVQVSGSVRLAGQELLGLPDRAMRRVRGRRIGMIFQEPMSALDPVFTIGEQITETLVAHIRLSAAQARERAVAALADVGIAQPRERLDSYPHQLSGGMRQRVMIAIALACEPELLIADEPTTALDVTVQGQILDLLQDCSARLGTALLLITHDLGVVAESCARVLTMYAGQVVETAQVGRALAHPRHPYTSGLLRSLPRLGTPGQRLQSIGGRVPPPWDMPPGCRFAPRCQHVEPRCALPQALEPDSRGAVRCCRHGELALPGAFG
ncbi:ABC transporter ATP-binding protein [Acidisphaera sp. L21]|uniref:ABC transporter ATP-binding protein n=1 Tax=Acidisphaera sp. L21 TaxID=1641851 RepID=UPI0020B10C5C|nr:ABC transporter ATP-binding protein [Acidisphaera sp. L21]